MRKGELGHRSGLGGANILASSRQVRTGSFDYFSVLVSVAVEDGAVPIDLCRAKDHGVTDVYLTDLTSSLLATSTARSVSGPSTIITDESSIFTFLPSERCLIISDRCLAYCEDTCLRTVTYNVDPTARDGIRLRVCNAEGTCI